MNILSLDLDFFMHGVAYRRGDSPEDRPNDHGITPWEPEAVSNFLLRSLNVRGQHPGRTVTSHHEVFYAWRDAISRGLLKPPFFVCHVDAHADLGMGSPSWVYLHSEFLELPLADRQYPQDGDWGLNFGSFMPYAIGNRWITSIDFIASESWCDDIPRQLLSTKHIPNDAQMFKPPKSLEIELMHAPRKRIEQNMTSFVKFRTPIGEPTIPFELLAHDGVGKRYSSTEWDFIFLSHSPGYVPESGDALLPLISAHISAF